MVWLSSRQGREWPFVRALAFLGLAHASTENPGAVLRTGSPLPCCHRGLCSFCTPAHPPTCQRQVRASEQSQVHAFSHPWVYFYFLSLDLGMLLLYAWWGWTAPWSAPDGDPFLVSLSCSFPCTFKAESVSTLFPFADPLQTGARCVPTGLQAVLRFLQPGGHFRGAPAPSGAVPAPRERWAVSGSPRAMACFAGFKGMCLTSLSSGDSPTYPTMPSWRWCPSPGAARAPRTR